jgi:hypothetical protein
VSIRLRDLDRAAGPGFAPRYVRFFEAVLPGWVSAGRRPALRSASRRTYSI